MTIRLYPDVPRPLSVVRVSFSQVRNGHVTASLRHTTGPLIPGTDVMAFESDGDELLFVRAKVVSYDQNKEVAALEFRRTEIRRAASAAEPVKYLTQAPEILDLDPLAIPV